jgi:hypothetical protein
MTSFKPYLSAKIHNQIQIPLFFCSKCASGPIFDSTVALVLNMLLNYRWGLGVGSSVGSGVGSAQK